MFSNSRAPTQTDAHSRTLLNVSFRVPSKAALPPGPPHTVPLEESCPIPRALIHYPVTALQYSHNYKQQH
jgi:hypothetical protein